MFEMAHLFEDALREYDELELCYLETGDSYFFCQDTDLSTCSGLIHTHTHTHSTSPLSGLQACRPLCTGLFILCCLIDLFILLYADPDTQMHLLRCKIHFVLVFVSLEILSCPELYISLILLIYYIIQT